jgi:polygalacturonase
MHLRCLFSIFFLSLFPGLAQAVTEQTVYPSGSSDQIAINQALESAYNAGGGTVFLSAGTYDIDGQIKIGSNTLLTGDSNAIIRVSSSSSQWFPDGTGIIGAIKEPLNNVEISGFQVDGNCKNLPRSYANSGNGDHNAERLIDLRASSDSFSNAISIHDLKLYDAFSDGIHIAFAPKCQYL